MTNSIAETIALKLLSDLVSRQGFKDVWSSLDDATKVTIMQQLITKTQAVLDGRTVSDTFNNVEGHWLHVKAQSDRRR